MFLMPKAGKQSNAGKKCVSDTDRGGMGARSPHIFNQCRASRNAVAESVKAIAEEYSRGNLFEAGQEPQRRHPPSGIAPFSQPRTYIGGDCYARLCGPFGGRERLSEERFFSPPNPSLFPKTFIPAIAHSAGCGIIEANKARRACLYQTKQYNETVPAADLFTTIGRAGRFCSAASPDGGLRRCGSLPASKRLPREYSSAIVCSNSATSFRLARL